MRVKNGVCQFLCIRILQYKQTINDERRSIALTKKTESFRRVTSHARNFRYVQIYFIRKKAEK